MIAIPSELQAFKCDRCKCNLGEIDGMVDCKTFGKIEKQTICAGQTLTTQGWVELANAAERSGDYERGKLYRQRIIELKWTR